jgi:hypothetical protein
MTSEDTTRFRDFQAEYEGSIPFTRSNDFNSLPRILDLIPTTIKVISATLAEDLSNFAMFFRAN